MKFMHWVNGHYRGIVEGESVMAVTIDLQEQHPNAGRLEVKPAPVIQQVVSTPLGEDPWASVGKRG